MDKVFPSIIDNLYHLSIKSLGVTDYVEPNE